MEAYKKLLFEDPKTILFVLLGIVAACFVVAWAWLARKGQAEGASTDRGHTLFDAIVAFVCTFFDTLGIGSFATTTAAFKFHESVPDEKIPGTLNVGYAIPTFAQAFIFIAIVKVDFKTLALMIAAAVAGSWFGAGIVAQWPRRRIQLGMGGALLVAAGLMLMKQFEIGPPEGESLTLAGTRLGLAIAANLLLGALMTLGIGLYGPCLIVVSLLGMDPRAAFPIMMGSCAFLMPVGGLRFVREGSYSVRAALAMSGSGLPAVLIAAFLVEKMPLQYVRWLVVVAVTYAATMLLRSARK
jgi:uncharacterized membrane protein YfcA